MHTGPQGRQRLLRSYRLRILCFVDWSHTVGNFMKTKAASYRPRSHRVSFIQAASLTGVIGQFMRTSRDANGLGVSN